MRRLVPENPLLVFDNRDNKLKYICRDGYYPPEILKQLIDVESFVRALDQKRLI